MTLNILFAIGTLLTWAGWYAAFRAVYLGLQLFLKAPRLDETRHMRSTLMSAILGVVGLGIGMALPSMLDKPAGGAVLLPLFWFVMPYSAWMGLLCAGFIIVRCTQAGFALNAHETIDRLKAAGLWALGLAVFLFLYFRDSENKITGLKGGIPLTMTTVAMLTLGLIAAMAAMVVAGRAARSRGFAKMAVNQIALIAGSILFGLPFAYLVVTSFKEDRDMSSPNGIVWIPRVQDTVPYKDPRNPLYEVSYKGQIVQGVVTETKGGIVKIDVQKPLAIRGTTVEAPQSGLKEIPRDEPIYAAKLNGREAKGFVVEDLEDGSKRLRITEPANLKGTEKVFGPADLEPVRHIGLLTQNYPDALGYLPPETNGGLVYLRNTLILVICSVVGTILSSSIVAYAFSRMKFPGRDLLFAILLSTMMLPSAVTLLPQFLIFRKLGWIDSLYPLWVPAFFASAFNVFLLRQFFKGIPMELEDAAKIDGCSYFRAFWSIMLPQIKPALAVIAIWTFMGAWNNFMGPLIYINSPENMPLSYALQLFQGDRGNEPGLMMAFATLTILPVLAVFFFAQKYFIEGVTLSGIGGR
jgi:multiple sugar transport system permease protein